jgi:hypothetical protein
MDTVVIAAMGVLTKDHGEYIEYDTIFNDGSLQRFLKAAKEKNFNVYSGLLGNHPTLIDPSSGNANDRNTDKGRLIDFSLRGHKGFWKRSVR